MLTANRIFSRHSLPTMPNHLSDETSPYLLQHKENPVDWFPWGDEAIGKATENDKPIFLSIGYSACHWCHVMAHECFEDEAIAAILNEHFVCIKVDREERPDLDQIYMNALHVYFQMAGSQQGGGWPLSMFLTPELKPFLGGTYWPPKSMHGRPGFVDVLREVVKHWEENREGIDDQSDRLTEFLQRGETAVEGGPELSLELLRTAEAALERNFDSRHGGFGGAPKFPHPLDVRLLLRLQHRNPSDTLRNMITLSLEKMAAGGIYDHLGGGFARYAVDERWLVPHFEKMLYDNAMLSHCYVEAFQATGDGGFARTARETYEYVLREMTHPDGGFFSAQDADSEGEEGKFYVWTPAEIGEVLDAEAAKTFCYVYDVSEEGNFEGKSVLNLPKTFEQCAKLLDRDREGLEAELAESRRRLLEARNRRVPPGLDDKILAAWNGLMIESLAVAAGALDEPRYLEAAAAAADFILKNMRRDDGWLQRSWRNGRARFDAYLDDYACLINALVSLYEAGFQERYIEEAVRLADIVQEQFADWEHGGYFYTAQDHEKLIARQKDIQDNPLPSGNAGIANALLRLGKLTGRGDYLPAAETTLTAFSTYMQRIPTATGQMLLALDLYLGPTYEIVVLGDAQSETTNKVLADLRHRYLPRKLLAFRDSADPSQGCESLETLFAGKQASEDGPTAFICRNFVCQAPISGEEKLQDAWTRLSEASDG